MLNNTKKSFTLTIKQNELNNHINNIIANEKYVNDYNIYDLDKNTLDNIYKGSYKLMDNKYDKILYHVYLNEKKLYIRHNLVTNLFYSEQNTMYTYGTDDRIRIKSKFYMEQLDINDKTISNNINNLINNDYIINNDKFLKLNMDNDGYYIYREFDINIFKYIFKDIGFNRYSICTDNSTDNSIKDNISVNILSYIDYDNMTTNLEYINKYNNLLINLCKVDKNNENDIIKQFKKDYYNDIIDDIDYIDIYNYNIGYTNNKINNIIIFYKI